MSSIRALPLTLSLLILLSVTASEIHTQTGAAKPTLSLESASGHPSKTAPFAGTVELKITSRKLEYRINDLITIDIAMLNASKAPVYVRASTPDDFQIRVVDASGASIDVRRYALVQRGISAESFELLESMEPLWNGSLLLLAGCQSDELQRYFVDRDKLIDDEKHGADVAAETYRRGLYANFGDACLNLKPGMYRVAVTAYNDYVVIDHRRSHVKTAVGELRSNELVIRVAENGSVEPPPN